MFTPNLYAPLDHDGTPAWPSEQLTTELFRLGENDKRPCALIATGALNPIHEGHLAMLAHARETLEQRLDFHVVGGCLSPSHDCYVGPKTEAQGTFFAEARHRVAMARLATACHDWLEVATWEARQPGSWPDYPEVIDALQLFLNERFQDAADEMVVFYVCGADHAKYCGQGLGKPRQGVVAVPRLDQVSSDDQPDQLVYWAPPLPGFEDFSSTHAREALAGGVETEEQARRMVGSDVLAYARQHGLYQDASSA